MRCRHRGNPSRRLVVGRLNGIAEVARGPISLSFEPPEADEQILVSDCRRKNRRARQELFAGGTRRISDLFTPNACIERLYLHSAGLATMSGSVMRQECWQRGVLRVVGPGAHDLAVLLVASSSLEESVI